MKNTFFLLIVLSAWMMGCSTSAKVAHQDKKKEKWLASLSTDPSDYHCVVSIPKSNPNEVDKEDLRSQARFIIADKMRIDASGSDIKNIFSEMDVEASKLKIIERSQTMIRAKTMEGLMEESTFKSDEEWAVSYRINKMAVQEHHQTLREKAMQQGRELLAKAMHIKNEKSPQRRADLLCEALLAVQDFLGEEMGDGDGFVDVQIYQNMLDLMLAMDIRTDPRDSVVLNKENAYTAILNFEILKEGDKSDALNVTIDVAGWQHDQIKVNEYSVLVSNLPMVLNTPWLTIRSDLYAKLREEGNALTQLVYASFSPLRKQVAIIQQFNPIRVSQGEGGWWDEQAVDMVALAMVNVGVLTAQEGEEFTDIAPMIMFSKEEKAGYYKVKGHWEIHVGTEMIKSKPLVTTKISLQKAKNDLLEKLHQQLTREVVPEIISHL